MIDTRRFHILIEQQVDIFIDCCKKYIEQKNIKAWVIKEEIASMVAIGDPDSLPHKKDFGFVIPYETIIKSHDIAFDEFVFKLEHFIKVANSTHRFRAFKTSNEQSHT